MQWQLPALLNEKICNYETDVFTRLRVVFLLFQFIVGIIFLKGGVLQVI